MSDTKWTPGEWLSEMDEEGQYITGRIVVADPDGKMRPWDRVVVGDSRHGTGVIRQTDAQLISASKELYSCLKAAVGRISDLEIILNEVREMGVTVMICGDTYQPDKSTAALAKARGDARSRR